MATSPAVVRIGDWEVTAENGRMASTKCEDELTEALQIKLPTMVFPNSSLVLRRPGSDFTLAFRAREALRFVGRADPSIRVRAAAAWVGKEDRTDVSVSQLESPSDWTFTTEYAGSLSGGELVTGHAVQCIDYDALRNRDIPIKFFSEVVLFEDELDDNGTASYRVRIRCMPKFLFLLARFFLRVDGVLVRIIDTRYFHRYTTSILVKETTHQESAFSALPSTLHKSMLTNPDIVASRLPVSKKTVVNIRC